MSTRSPKDFIIFFFLIVFLLVGIVHSIDKSPGRFSARPYKRVDSVPGELIVKFKEVPGVGSSAKMSSSVNSAVSLVSRAEIKKIKEIGPNGKAHGYRASSNTVDTPGVYRLKYKKNEDIYAIKKDLLNDPSVEYAEPNYVYQMFVEPNDPNFKYQWGLTKIGASNAWDVNKGDASVVIAVIDTGVDYTHQDLSGNIWSNDDEIPGNGIDSDIINVSAINTIINIRYPDSDNPFGVGNKNRISAIKKVINNHRFCVSQ